MRLYPAKFYVKQVLETGQLGHIVSAYSNTANALNIPLEMLPSWSTRSGPQWFKFSHTVDTLRWLLDKQEAVEVYARGSKGILREMGVDAYDSIHAVVTYESGAWVTYDTAWIQPNAWDEDIDTYFVLTCSHGMAKATPTEATIADHDTEMQLRSQITRYAPPDFAQTRLNLGSTIARFVGAVETDTEPWVTGEDGLAVVATICAMEESIETGKPVKMADFVESA
jgi:predicted dehydrogenase